MCECERVYVCMYAPAETECVHACTHTYIHICIHTKEEFQDLARRLSESLGVPLDEATDMLKKWQNRLGTKHTYIHTYIYTY